ncbi:MAG: TIM barrel protein [Kiritimatiellae bacterium]|nr:TIM barrel protein [Kiritimatiellia bacterium]
MPRMALGPLLETYSAMGYRKFEVFTRGVASAFDLDEDPAVYLYEAAQRGVRYTSLHLPAISEDLDNSMRRAVQGARFAKALGAPIVLYKAASRELYVRGARRVLDECEQLGITAVLQNHCGTPIASLDDFRTVIDSINDNRMRTLLEVGHFHSAGVSWREGCACLGARIALIHIKDQIGRQSVPFGTGEIDLPGLFRHMAECGYTGDYVVEMEVTDSENTLRYLAEAREHIETLAAKPQAEKSSTVMERRP